MNDNLTHIDENNQPGMVDVSTKGISTRTATAMSILNVPENLRPHIQGDEISSKKGPVFQTAIIAGTQAVKKTAELIPFCHPLPIESCKFNLNLKKETIEIQCTVKTRFSTGVEMEALTGVSVAALTIYDMCKAVAKDMQIQSTMLLEKTGGKSDFHRP